MFAFSQVEPNRNWQMTHWDIPVNRWLSTKFEAGLDYRAHEAVSRMTEDFIADGPEISQELANKQWGIPGHLEFTGPINNQRAALMNQRKKKELELSAKLEMADHSWASWKGVAGFGAMMAGGMASPLDAALMFLPVVGHSAKAKAAALAGRGVFRQALARGVITEEALRRFTAFPQFGAAVIDGTIGNALAEIPVFIQKTRDQADYGPADAALNIAGGGIFAGALHLGFRGLARVFNTLSPEIREHVLREEVDAFLKSETAQSHLVAKVDENAIAARVEEDLRVEAETALGGKPLPENSVVTVQAAQRLDEATEVPGFVQVDIVEGGKNIRSTNPETLKAEGFAVHSSQDFARLPQGRYTIPEAQAKLKEITGEPNGSSHPEIEQRLANERERRIREYIDSRKPERIAAAKAAELQAQQAQGKILSEEQIKEFTLASDEQSAAAIKADAANIEANLKSELQSKLQDEALTPEQKEALQAELDEALEQVEEGLEDQTKAIEQAKNCLIANG